MHLKSVLGWTAVLKKAVLDCSACIVLSGCVRISVPPQLSVPLLFIMRLSTYTASSQPACIIVQLCAHFYNL